MWSILPSFFAWSLLERDSLLAQRFVLVSRDAGQQPGQIDKAGLGHISRLPIVGRARSGWQGAGRRCGAATPGDAGGVCALHGVRSATKSVPCAERSRASLRRAHSQRIKGQRRRVWQRFCLPGANVAQWPRFGVRSPCVLVAFPSLSYSLGASLTAPARSFSFSSVC